MVKSYLCLVATLFSLGSAAFAEQPNRITYPAPKPPAQPPPCTAPPCTAPPSAPPPPAPQPPAACGAPTFVYAAVKDDCQSNVGKKSCTEREATVTILCNCKAPKGCKFKDPGPTEFYTGKKMQCQVIPPPDTARSQRNTCGLTVDLADYNGGCEQYCKLREVVRL